MCPFPAVLLSVGRTVLSGQMGSFHGLAEHSTGIPWPQTAQVPISFTLLSGITIFALVVICLGGGPQPSRGHITPCNMEGDIHPGIPQNVPLLGSSLSLPMSSPMAETVLLPSPKLSSGLFVTLFPSEPTEQRNVATPSPAEFNRVTYGKHQGIRVSLPQQLLTAYIFSGWGGDSGAS